MNSALLKMALNFLGPSQIDNALTEITQTAIQKKREIALLPGEEDLVIMIFEAQTETGPRLDCTICTLSTNNQVIRQVYTFEMKELLQKFIENLK